MGRGVPKDLEDRLDACRPRLVSGLCARARERQIIDAGHRSRRYLGINDEALRLLRGVSGSVLVHKEEIVDGAMASLLQEEACVSVAQRAELRLSPLKSSVSRTKNWPWKAQLCWYGGDKLNPSMLHSHLPL